MRNIEQRLQRANEISSIEDIDYTCSLIKSHIILSIYTSNISSVNFVNR